MMTYCQSRHHGTEETWVVKGRSLPAPDAASLRWPDPAGAHFYKRYGYNNDISPADYLRMQGKQYSAEVTP